MRASRWILALALCTAAACSSEPEEQTETLPGTPVIVEDTAAATPEPTVTVDMPNAVPGADPVVGADTSDH